MSIYAVGDIHGHLDKLTGLIGNLPLQDDDQLVFLGDYVDRGPDSKGVIDYLIELRTRRDCVFVRGNHDHMFLDHIKGCQVYSRGLWVSARNAGVTCLRSYGDPEAEPGELQIPEAHLRFLSDLCNYYVKDGFVFVHGGLREGIPLEKNTYRDLYWLRDFFYNSRYKWPEGVVVFGHTPFRQPLVEDNKIGIDTGCAAGGPLTAVKLPEVELFQFSS